ncbi:MAG: hypothetical protein AB7S54_01925 [Bacteroidales bacterium]
MIKRIINITVAGLLAVLVIFTSSGATIFLHHCACRGKAIFSIYHEVGCKMASHSSLAGECCGLTDTKIKSESESCGCSNDEISIKLNNSTVVSTSTPVSQELAVITLLNHYQYKFLASTLIQENNLYNESNSPPPPRWGKELLIGFRSLKLSGILS